MDIPVQRTMQADVLIVGASHAGVECAWALRQAGFAGRIVLLDAQAAAPYQRPPLSKALLAGATDAQRLALRSSETYQKQSIEHLPGHAVARLDAGNRTALTQQGLQVRFTHCVIATGARARRLPGLDGAGAYCIRTLDDSLALRPRLADGLRLLVLGGGYLGLEAASTAAKLGARVTVIEQSGCLMGGKVSAATAARFEALHRQAGIEILRGTGVQRWEAAAHGWTAALADGRRFDAEAVLVSIGAVPNTELAEQAGIRCADGVVVDASCRSSADGIYAIGDCASSHRPELGRPCRIESVQNALEQARVAAAAIAGTAAPSPRPPTFWSEQQGRRLQIAGLADPRQPCDDQLAETAKGWLVERRQAGRLVAVEAVDSPVEFMQATKRIGASDVPAAATLTP